MPSFLERIEPLRRRRWLAWMFGAFALLAAFGLRRLIDDAVPGSPFLVYLPAILATALIGGTWPGLAAAALAGMAVWLSAMPSAGGWGERVAALALFAAVAGFELWLTWMLKATADRLRAEQKRSGELLELQQTMFQELQHRVANNMQFISSLLTLHRRQVRHSPDAVAALDTAATRLQVMARIHRRLYQPVPDGAAFGRVLEEIGHDLLEATGARGVVCRVEAVPIEWAHDRLVSLALLVTELLTNALKHGFGDGRGGTIRITLERLDPARLALTVQDDGSGLPADFHPATAPGLGMQIVRSLAARLGGELSFGNGAGTTARLVLAG